MQIADYIRDAVTSHRPLILRHHADTDGICGALAIEKACRALIPEKRRIERYIIRKPTITPFYDLNDALWDMNHINRFMHDQKPLLILIDIGSTKDNLDGIRLSHRFGLDIIVIDHHKPEIAEGKCEVDDYTIFHQNPYLFDMDHKLVSSVQCYEIANKIHEGVDAIFPALGAVGDRTEMPEYIHLSGRTLEELKELSICFDYLGFTLRGEPATAIFELILKDDNVRKIILDHLDIDSKIDRVMKDLKTEDIYGITLATLELDDPDFLYPTPGKIAGFVFERIKSDRAILLCSFNEAITIRESEEIVSVQDIISLLSEKGITVSGGGHEVAGTIRLSQSEHSRAKEMIRNEIKRMMDK